MNFCLFKGSTYGRPGFSWDLVPGKLMQIDSGIFRVVWGLNRYHQVFYRTGITWNRLKGTRWRFLRGLRLKYLSISQFGVWGVNRNYHIFFRRITPKSLQGK